MRVRAVTVAEDNERVSVFATAPHTQILNRSPDIIGCDRGGREVGGRPVSVVGSRRPFVRESREQPNEPFWPEIGGHRASLLDRRPCRRGVKDSSRAALRRDAVTMVEKLGGHVETFDFAGDDDVFVTARCPTTSLPPRSASPSAQRITPVRTIVLLAPEEIDAAAQLSPYYQGPSPAPSGVQAADRHQLTLAVEDGGQVPRHPPGVRSRSIRWSRARPVPYLTCAGHEHYRRACTTRAPRYDRSGELGFHRGEELGLERLRGMSNTAPSRRDRARVMPLAIALRTP